MNRSGRSVLFWTGIAIVVVLASLQKVAAAERPSSPGDDIKVHGHWTLDVRNPDGTVASHNEFENACTQCGQALGMILSRQAAFAWEVLLDGIPGPCESGGIRANCKLAEVGTPVAPDFANYLFATLTLSPVGDAGATFTLHGNLVATYDGQISTAESIANLNTGARLQFSQRTLGTPIQVAAGQTVYVTVTFSFS